MHYEGRQRACWPGTRHEPRYMTTLGCRSARSSSASAREEGSPLGSSLGEFWRALGHACSTNLLLEERMARLVQCRSRKCLPILHGPENFTAIRAEAAGQGRANGSPLRNSSCCRGFSPMCSTFTATSV